MTTIATDGRSMAGDGRMMIDGKIVIGTAFAKVRRLKSGAVVGVAGDPFAAEKFVKWADGKRMGSFYSDAEFSALIMDCVGVHLFGPSGESLTVETPFAIGSGRCFAMGAMDAGASPAEAIVIAAMRDSETGGTIVNMECRS